MNRGVRNFLVLAFLAVAFYLVVRGGPFRAFDAPQEVKYRRLLDLLEEDRVLQGEFDKDTFQFQTDDGARYYVVLPDTPESRTDLHRKLEQKRVNFTFRRSVFSDALQGLLPMVLPLLLVVFFWFLILRQMQAGSNQALSFGRSRAKRASESVPKVTFEDVAGIDEAKEELQEIVDFLKNPKKFQALGAKIPKGVLLLGPPGCGKTLLARAIAGEAGVPFFHISGSDFVEMFVGVGASRVRDLFDTAKANRPCIVFIDEIDAVGRQRGAGLGGGHDEREQTLNQLLVEMDGFDPNTGVILLAATNRPDILDPALLRPGRFDRRIVVDTPDVNGRRDIFKVHLKGKPLADDVDAEVLARRTPGFTGADIANLVNEAALLAARRDKQRIDMSDFDDAIERVIAGPERRSKIISEKEREMVAFHEVGHAIVGELLPNADPVQKVTILPRGRALGYTLQLPERDRYLLTRAQLLDEITSLLGGRAAEKLIYNEATTGANNDLERATEIARAMVCEYGMSEKLGNLTFGRRHGNPFLGRDIMEDRNYSEEVAYAIDQEVRAIIDECFRRAVDILSKNRDKMEEIVRVLLQKETIEREEFLALMEGAQPAEAISTWSTTPPQEEQPEETPQESAPRVPVTKRLRTEPGIA
ncbi:MAG: ATP-dependent zinc metalloprotease FtsH [Armatimonadota bacterium]|nr:ATP-dependent zinc metalloprotease FtsH [Armatimonadota bacterium]MDW8290593.1 ATP-dependent zinc metalloprotease FtsH [Armatimonadota bacterium]